jgi:hypothetical protein
MQSNYFQKIMNQNMSTIIPSTFNPNFQKKRRERKGKDQIIGRNFICGCGKSYLSYAALYTHAKTKHSGVFPAGTSTLKKSKFKKNLTSPSTNSNFDMQNTHFFNQEFLTFLEKIPGASRSSEETSFNPVEDFPSDIFCSESNHHLLLKKFASLHKSLVGAYSEDYLKQYEFILSEISLCKGLVCYEIFSLFLLYVYRFVSREFFRELVFFVISYTDMLNEKGWLKCRELVNTFHIRHKVFCLNQGSEIVPDLSNEFILKFFPKALESNLILEDPSVLTFFGNDSIKILRAILVIKHISDWLNIYGFTQSRIEILKH